MIKFKKVAIVARDPDNIIDLKKNLSDFEYDEKNPDFIVCLGGDGTFLFAERLFPGIPKLHIKDSEICTKCSEGKIYELISKILRKEFSIEENMKLESTINDKTWLATNNFAIRNILPTQAIRFIVRVDGKQIDDTIIGDGILVSTPFGSTAYFQSVTRKTFDDGIGVAFNNTTKPHEHLFLDENSKVEFELLRGDACFVSDNDLENLKLIEGQVITMKKSKQTAKVIKFN